MDDMVEFKSIISVGEALYVQRIVLFVNEKQIIRKNHDVMRERNNVWNSKVYLMADDGDTHDHIPRISLSPSSNLDELLSN